MIGCLARATIAARHRPQIQPPNDLHHEPRQVSLRQPLVHRGRKQKPGVTIDRTEIAHAYEVHRSQLVRCILFYRTIPRRVKSDRLLGAADMAADLGVATAWPPLVAVRSRLVLACALAGVTPID